jgi:hypothetical protein
VGKPKGQNRSEDLRAGGGIIIIISGFLKTVRQGAE